MPVSPKKAFIFGEHPGSEARALMLIRLRRAGRWRTALVRVVTVMLVLAPLFVLSPVASMASPRTLFIHVHGDGAEAHRFGHFGHYQQHTQSGDRLADRGTGDDSNDREPGRAHVHYDACWPSFLISIPARADRDARLAERLPVWSATRTQGAPPGRLLRPPISSDSH